MSLGKNIKFHRMNRFLTQEELAEGLISVSYLSKIENDQVVANQDVIEQLCLRLNIPTIMMDEKELENDLHKFYIKMLNKELENLDEDYKNLSKRVKKNVSYRVKYLFDLFTIRYLQLSEELEKSTKLIKKIETVIKDFDDIMLFYFYNFKGINCCLEYKFDEAFKYFEKVEKLIANNNTLMEKAEIYYLLGLSASQSYNSYISISYTKKALTIYREIYKLNRSCDCHVLLGIVYTRLKEYEEAEKHYKWAEVIAKDVNYKAAFNIIYHNLGSLNSIQKKVYVSIPFYLQSLDHIHKEDFINRTITIMAIIKDLYNDSKIEEIKNWLPELEEYEEQLKQKFIILYHEYMVFKFLINKDYENFLEYTIKKAIPYMEKQDNFLLCSYYAELVANYFKENRKYKQAVYYLEYTNNLIKFKLR